MDERTCKENATSQWEHPLDFPVMEQNFSLAQKIFQTLLIVVGMLLNATVLFVVSLSRQLRYPRHVFWAAISFFECVFLVQSILEMVVILNRSDLACPPYVILASVDYSVLLLCLSLAALDRYLAIARYEWYKKKVTNRGVVVLISVTSTLTFVIITAPFWTGYISIYACTINLTHVHWVLAWDLLLGIVCLILHLKIFTESKKLMRQYRTNYRQSITVKFVNTSSRNFESGVLGTSPTAERIFVEFPENPSVAEFLSGNNTTHVHSGNTPKIMAPYNDSLGAECFPWMPMRSKVNRLEVRAALNMSINILPFWLCTFPVSCDIIALYWCIRLNGDVCEVIDYFWPYLWNVFLLHSIYNPGMYMLSSYEFRRALPRATRKLMNIFGVRVNENWEYPLADDIFFCIF